MKYYLTKTDVRRGDPQKGEPAIVATEVVMTKPATYKATEGARQRWTAMGIERKMTKADLAEIVAEFAENEENKEEGNND